MSRTVPKSLGQRDPDVWANWRIRRGERFGESWEALTAPSAVRGQALWELGPWPPHTADGGSGDNRGQDRLCPERETHSHPKLWTKKPGPTSLGRSPFLNLSTRSHKTLSSFFQRGPLPMLDMTLRVPPPANDAPATQSKESGFEFLTKHRPEAGAGMPRRPVLDLRGVVLLAPSCSRVAPSLLPPDSSELLAPGLRPSNG